MVIYFLIPNLNIGGAERVVVNLANGFNKCGYHVYIVLINDEYNALKPFVNQEVGLISLESMGSWRARQKLLNLIIRDKPDVLISSLPNCNIISGWVIKRLPSDFKTKLICIEHGVYSEMIKNFSFIRRLITTYLLRRYYKFADKIIAVSEAVKADLAKICPILSNKIEVIYDPIDFAKIRDLSLENIEHPFFQTGAKVIVSVGRLSPEKGFDLLIWAFRKIRDSLATKLIILGSGTQKEYLLSLVNELGLQNDVDIISGETNPYKYIARAALFVSSSISEGFGLTILEALVCKVRVVATDAGGIARNILSDGKLGKLIPPNNIDALVEAIISEIDRGEIDITEELNQFSLDYVVNKYLEVIRQ